MRGSEVDRNFQWERDWPLVTDELAWRTLDARIAYSCDGFDVVNEDVALPDDTRTEFDYVVEGESVVILPFTTDGRVVVIDEWRQAVDRVNRGLPAGCLESHDDEPADGVRRELAEETGYEPGSTEHLTTVEPANGFADSVFHYYVAYDCEQTAEQDLDHNESIHVATTTFDELLAAARVGELRDGRSMMAVLYHELFDR